MWRGEQWNEKKNEKGIALFVYISPQMWSFSWVCRSNPIFDWKYKKDSNKQKLMQKGDGHVIKKRWYWDKGRGKGGGVASCGGWRKTVKGLYYFLFVWLHKKIKIKNAYNRIHFFSILITSIDLVTHLFFIGPCGLNSFKRDRLRM